MKDKDRSRDLTLPQGTGQSPKRKSVSASDVGISLTISESALKEVDRIHCKAIKAAQAVRNHSWR